MFDFAKPIMIGAALFGALAVPAASADLYEPPIVETPAPVQYVEPAFGGWYIRGDIDYSKLNFRGAEYSVVALNCNPCGGVTGARIVGGNVLDGELKESFSLGGGIGYQITRYLRTDLTLDWQSKSKFRGSTTGCGGACTSEDLSELTALTLMANAYADLGTYGRITPYVGGGLGGTHIKWDGLQNTACPTTGPGACTTNSHEGYKDWRFAWALMAGASVKITHNLAFDLGYKYQRVSGGRMFGFDDAVGGPYTGHGYDKGIDFHSVRAGLRYTFGAPEVASYEPEPIAPVYK